MTKSNVTKATRDQLAIIDGLQKRGRLRRISDSELNNLASKFPILPQPEEPQLVTRDRSSGLLKNHRA
jgi:hypothetical protein